MITVVGLVHVEAGRLLVVRSRNKKAFYLPGGKIEPGESLEEALLREVSEELGVDAARPEVLKRYVAPAYGEGEGAMVDMTCFTAQLKGTPRPAGEIAELTYVTRDEYRAHAETAPAIHEVLDDLVASSRVRP
ncbi:NUDIX hydrolase [Lentzea flaviverrucosa]|uniref:ADP-ribose pyrophosphatase YjhB, NUDIX family n=1 Tax=Lentzea flaviverrucosa TaxID=200379 RepID=A0A1H9MS30_9PSEU|nr:NUDIX domain-containing protein [Lentzea flaviverrucosa]RDI30816.1 ADP-ribose pyrophosphatase YjhB (NUDIX family) [Lentzea flaviverrucosa]SER26225.1 ADP-ribose pyrophosphatase YjhB, NUDIX family [Lentzea flaviverrucosa]